MRMEDEISTIRDITQWKLIRNRGQISQEIQYSVQYYKDICVSKEKLFGNTIY
jgi:hypothetical protein